MKKNKITFLILECIFLILTLFFAWKIFDRDVPEKRVAVILPESGDNRWNSLIKGMKQSAKINNLHMIICNTDEIENAEMEIPEAMLDTQCRQMMDDFGRRMQSQGLSMEQYFQFTGQTAEKMMEDMKPQALKRIQTRLVLEKIVEVENIQPTEEEVNEEISKMAAMYKMEADKLKELVGEREMEQMKKDMAVQKAVTFVAEAAKEA